MDRRSIGLQRLVLPAIRAGRDAWLSSGILAVRSAGRSRAALARRCGPAGWKFKRFSSEGPVFCAPQHNHAGKD